MGCWPTIWKSLKLSWQQRQSLPQTLILFVTARCNARCDFCLYKDSVENPTSPEHELTKEEYQSIAATYGPLHYLALSGGEPFLRQDLGNILESFIVQCGTSVIDIPSNFYYQNTMVELVGGLLPKYPRTMLDLQLSIDHTKHQRKNLLLPRK